MPESLTIDGVSYTLVGVQREGISAVYRGPDRYLRLGETHKMERDLMFHKRMESAGFPVAKLLEEGEYEGRKYFVEASLGEKRLGITFGEDYGATGAIEAEHFNQMMEVVETHVRAQFSAQVPVHWAEFALGIHLDFLLKELPESAAVISAKFEAVQSKLSTFPFVVTHGDFNPQNMYANGVIDLEDSFVAPAAYDAITAIVHIDSFPDTDQYEYFARYRFSPAQVASYLQRIDSLFNAQNLPSPSAFKDEFAFCRLVWSAVRMHKWPKIQQWRYDLLMDRFLK